MADGTAHDNPEIRVCVPLVQDFAYLAAHMRQDERDQFAAFTGMDDYDPNVAARAFVMTGGLAYALVDRAGRPVAIGWFEELRPGVWETCGIGTPEAWTRYWRTITKQARIRMNALFAGGAHRIQIASLATRTDAHGWYERGLQMTCEGRLRRYCGSGADAVMHARVKEI